MESKALVSNHRKKDCDSDQLEWLEWCAGARGRRARVFDGNAWGRRARVFVLGMWGRRARMPTLYVVGGTMLAYLRL